MHRRSSSDFSSSSGTSSQRLPPHATTSPGTATPHQQCVIVLVEAYASPLEKTFRCVLERMERTTRSVVIVSCLTMVPNIFGGMKLPVASVERKWREEAVQHQWKALSFCVQNVQHLFEERRVKLDILVKIGETNEMIAIHVAQHYRPRWIVVDSSLLNGRQGKQFCRTLNQNPEIKKFSSMAYVLGGSVDPSFEVSGAFFAASEPVVTSVEVTVEEHTEKLNSIGCGLFTCFRVSSSSSKRSVSRDEERASFRMRTRSE